MTFKTPQEEFWAGEFGDQYVTRNSNEFLISSSTAMFTTILQRTNGIHSILEFGANIGINLEALKRLLPNATFAAIEINQRAAEILESKQGIKVFQESILTFNQAQTYDLTFTRGVLIHMNPETLDTVYQKLYDLSNRYVLIAEYYNPSPVTIEYRGHKDRLFKRDFAGEILEKFSDLQLVDYGFIYKRDPYFPQDDITWFLFEKH